MWSRMHTHESRLNDLQFLAYTCVLSVFCNSFLFFQADSEQNQRVMQLFVVT